MHSKTSYEDYLEKLNPEQKRAVEHIDGPALILAGAGSGKTRVLTVRIGNLIKKHGVPPSRILALTFTNKAAGEMKERIVSMLGTTPDGLWMGTFHSFGAFLMRQHAQKLGYSNRFTILDAEQSIRRIKNIMIEKGFSVEKGNPEWVHDQISSAKNQLLTPSEYAVSLDGTKDRALVESIEVYRAYEENMCFHNCLDFDDLLLRPVLLLRQYPDILEKLQNRFKYILVDEYQDTNRSQYELVKMLADKSKNVMVVGDDDQSIYGWRGADIRNILDFENDFPGAAVVRLEENYRSTSTILDAANEVIQNNTKRKGKQLRTSNDCGEKITIVRAATDIAEAGWIADEIESRLNFGHAEQGYASFAVLYRTNAQSRILEDTFRKRGIPYQIVGGLSFYDRREIKDCLGYLRLVSNPRDVDAFDRVVNYPKRGLGGKSVEKLMVWAKENNVVPLEAAARAPSVPGISKKAAEKFQEFSIMIQQFASRALEVPVGDLVMDIIDRAGVVEALKEEKDSEDRVENVKELIASAKQFDTREGFEELPEGEFSDLDLFLQKVALVTAVDSHEDEVDRVTLMTMHAAKGLEFPYVFIGGLETGLFPHARSLYSADDLEEERRLFYVGITRAQLKLYLLYAECRRRGADYEYNSPSKFLEELPRNLCKEEAASYYSSGW